MSSSSLIHPAAGSVTVGVNVAGYLRTESGVGTAVRRYIRALRALGVPASLHDLSDLQGNRSEDPTLTTFARDYPYDVNLVCADVELHFAIMANLGEQFFRDRYNVGIWAWELPRFPEKWYDRFAYYDEIWVGTSFIANALAPISPLPVVRIPPVLTVDAPGSRDAGRQRLGVTPDVVVYLFVFDFHSHFERKNPLAVIDAFAAAFASSDAVRLVIKCVNAESDPVGFYALRDRARGHPITILSGYWSGAQVRDLMAACDTYVSLHRAEGTGLTMSDAMALGKPVIATGWSGNMDFMTSHNSFPVAYELVEIAENVGPYGAGEIWAEPSVVHAAQLMRLVYEDPVEATARGRVARQDIETHFSEPAVARVIAQRLAAIMFRCQYAEFKQQTWAEYARYRRLGAELRERVRCAVPHDATILVVSKGDLALLEMDGRPSWHFPQTESGEYAGYYPPDSNSAIAHLETLRSKGGDYLLFPSTAFWWLDHYVEFRRHLDAHYSRVTADECCVIYDLSVRGGSDVKPRLGSPGLSTDRVGVLP